MSREPTSTLTFADLIIEVARKIGVAYYGPDGTSEVQVPVDAHDLAECKRHVNNAIRMFINDGPEPNSWNWLRPVATLFIWGEINVDADNTVSSGGYDPLTDKTLITAEAASFYETMELKTLVVTGVGSFTVTDYVSSTQVKVRGNATAVSAATWSMDSEGSFTLPRDFGGEYLGDITYVSDTNQGVSIDWVDESRIRQWREDITDETGDPFWAAIRVAGAGEDSVARLRKDTKRRWELLLYPQPDEVMEVTFPYLIGFDKLTDLDEVPPTPFPHDEAIKAACLAIVEKDVEDRMGVNWDYYTTKALPKSYSVDARSRPKKLGYNGNPASGLSQSGIKFFRNKVYDRPRVSFNS